MVYHIPYMVSRLSINLQPMLHSHNIGHNTSKISNQRSRLGGNVSKVSVRSCDSRLSMTGQQMNAQQQCGYELGRLNLISLRKE